MVDLTREVNCVSSYKEVVTKLLLELKSPISLKHRALGSKPTKIKLYDYCHRNCSKGDN